MSTEAKHTPTPWQLAVGRYILAKVGPPRHERGTVEIAVLAKGDDWEEEQEANAALIVRAVNSHHEMLEALKTIAAYPVASLYPDGPCIHRDDMKEIKAIIAKAEEAQPLSTHQAV